MKIGLASSNIKKKKENRMQFRVCANGNANSNEVVEGITAIEDALETENKIEVFGKKVGTREYTRLIIT